MSTRNLVIAGVAVWFLFFRKSSSASSPAANLGATAAELAGGATGGAANAIARDTTSKFARAEAAARAAKDAQDPDRALED